MRRPPCCESLQNNVEVNQDFLFLNYSRLKSFLSDVVPSLVASVDTVGVDPSVTLYVGMGMLTGIDCAGPEVEGGPAGTLVGAALKYPENQVVFSPTWNNIVIGNYLLTKSVNLENDAEDGNERTNYEEEVLMMKEIYGLAGTGRNTVGCGNTKITARKPNG